MSGRCARPRHDPRRARGPPPPACTADSARRGGDRTARPHTNEAEWPAFAARYGTGDIADGEVVSITPFGAFIRIDGVDGFAPRSSWPTQPQQGTMVRVRIEAIDNDQRRFAVIPA